MADDTLLTPQANRYLELTKTTDLNLKQVRYRNKKFTQPPSWFTEASLVKELEEKGIEAYPLMPQHCRLFKIEVM